MLVHFVAVGVGIQVETIRAHYEEAASDIPPPTACMDSATKWCSVFRGFVD